MGRRGRRCGRLLGWDLDSVVLAVSIGMMSWEVSVPSTGATFFAACASAWHVVLVLKRRKCLTVAGRGRARGRRKGINGAEEAMMRYSLVSRT